MKRIVFLILLLAVITAGCSYEIMAENSQEFQGESSNWKVDYIINFTTNYPQKDGKIYAQREHQDEITVTYKGDLSDLSGVKSMEISYKNSFGSGGKRTEYFDSPLTKKQFRLGGVGGTSTYESGGYPQGLENLQQTILTYSGPSYEMRTNATATVRIQVDGESDTIQLLPVKDPSPIPALLEQINNKLSKKPFLKFFSGHASDLLLKLEEFDVRVVTDKAVSGSINVTEGDNAGQELVPTVLYYEFTIINEGRKTISGSLNDLQVKIVPSENLKEVSEETVGMNIFESDSELGCGQSMSGDIFNIRKASKFTMTFDLSKEGPHATLITPSAEKLEKLLDYASDASLIIMYKEEEAARFDLNKR